jgi:hypothetical protein
MNISYIPLYSCIWRDRIFKSLPSSDAQLLFLNILSNDSMSLTGIYQLDIDMCHASVKKIIDFDTAFCQVVSSGMVEWDEVSTLIWVRNRFKFIPTKSAKVILGAIKELNMIDHPFKEDFIKKYHDEINPFRWALKGNQVTQEELVADEQLLSIAKIYNSKKAVKNFLINRGLKEERIDEIINRTLSNLKP